MQIVGLPALLLLLLLQEPVPPEETFHYFTPDCDASPYRPAKVWSECGAAHSCDCNARAMTTACKIRGYFTAVTAISHFPQEMIDKEESSSPARPRVRCQTLVINHRCLR